MSTLLQLGDGACVFLRLGGLWPGLRGLAVRLPFIAFPAGVNAEGVMVLVNARGTRGRATEGQFVVIHPPAAVPRVQRRCGSEGNGLGLGATWGAASCLAGRASPGKSGAVGQCESEGEGQGFGTSVEAASGFAGSAS